MPARRPAVSESSTVVIGAGPAGLAAALALRRYGLDVLVIEASDRGGPQVNDMLRPNGKRLLRCLGLSDTHFERCCVESHGIDAAWSSAAINGQDFFVQPYGLAWHVERPVFDTVLAAAAERAGVSFLRSAGLTALERKNGFWRVTVATEDRSVTVGARFLIDATGRAARVARRLGVARLTYDRSIALWATCEPAGRDTGTRLLLEAAADGWWYSIPLPCGRLLAAYVTDADLLRRAIPIYESWSHALSTTRQTRARLRHRRGTDGSRVMVRPASIGRLAQAAGPGWLAVGDAAATLDPLSGSGLTEALASGERAAATVAADAAGETGAFVSYSAQAALAFDSHLADRARHYRAVDRFAGHLFWRRRCPIDPADIPVTLDPMARLIATEKPAATATARLEGLMPKQDIARLWALCAQPQEAHRVIARYKEGSAAPLNDRAAIIALQVMTEEFVVQSVARR